MSEPKFKPGDHAILSADAVTILEDDFQRLARFFVPAVDDKPSQHAERFRSENELRVVIKNGQYDENESYFRDVQTKQRRMHGRSFHSTAVIEKTSPGAEHLLGRHSAFRSDFGVRDAILEGYMDAASIIVEPNEDARAALTRADKLAALFPGTLAAVQ